MTDPTMSVFYCDMKTNWIQRRLGGICVKFLTLSAGLKRGRPRLSLLQYLNPGTDDSSTDGRLRKQTNYLLNT